MRPRPAKPAEQAATDSAAGGCRSAAAAVADIASPAEVSEPAAQGRQRGRSRLAAGEVASWPAGRGRNGAGRRPSLQQPAAAGESRPKADIETALGTRWAVWVGGIALALGGLFLIRYTIEAGIFGPGVRLTMAALLGLVLVGGGEFIRRTGFKVPVQGAAGAYIPAILTAAGAFILFGTVYAAHGIYGFIGPAFAFTAARRHRRGDDRRRSRPRPGAGRHRPARLDGDAGACVLAGAQSLGAVRLSGDRACRHRASSPACATGSS